MSLRTEGHCVTEFTLDGHLILLIVAPLLLAAPLFLGLVIRLWEGFGEAALTWCLNLLKSLLNPLPQLYPVGPVPGFTSRIHPGSEGALGAEHAQELGLESGRGLCHHFEFVEVAAVDAGLGG